MESPSLEGFHRCVNVTVGDMVSGGSAGLTVELNNLRGLFQPK